MDIKNANAWKAKTQAMRKRVKTSATEHVRSQAFRLFKFVVDRTPQYSGDLVLNWNIETTNTGMVSYDSSRKTGGFDWYKAAYTKADFERNKREPLARAKHVLSTVKWNSNIRIANSSPTAQIIAYDEDTKFRQENYENVKDSAEVLTQQWNIRAVTMVKFKYLRAPL